MTHIIGKAKPPRQVLHSTRPIFVDINPDTAQMMLVQKLRRRARKVTTAGIVKSPIIYVTYEIFADGAIMRIDEGGVARRVPEGHSEWKWARAVLNAVHARKVRGEKAPLPPDFVSYATGPASCLKEGD